MRTASRAARACAAAAAAALVTGCQPGPDVLEAGATAGPSAFAEASPPDPALRAAMRAAPDVRADFPVEARPRPVRVLSEQAALSGFRTSGAKVAYGSGNWTVPDDLPAAPASYQGHPVVPARDAPARLRAR